MKTLSLIIFLFSSQIAFANSNSVPNLTSIWGSTTINARLDLNSNLKMGHLELGCAHADFSIVSVDANENFKARGEYMGDLVSRTWTPKKATLTGKVHDSDKMTLTVKVEGQPNAFKFELEAGVNTQIRKCK